MCGHLHFAKKKRHNKLDVHLLRSEGQAKWFGNFVALQRTSNAIGTRIVHRLVVRSKGPRLEQILRYGVAKEHKLQLRTRKNDSETKTA
jgi:hypothetical protein